MTRRSDRSISLPIILGAIAVALCITMLVAWTLVIAHNLDSTHDVTQDVWLLVAGIVSLAAIISVLVLFSVFLVREILEGRRQTHFIDSVTHELRSPLASLNLCIQTMERDGLSTAQLATIRTMMRHDVERLSTFIQDILEASRIAHGRRSHNFAKVNLRQVLHRCIEQVCRRYDMQADCVRVTLGDDLHLVTDETALETIIKNILDNAIKYSNPPPDIAIEGNLRQNSIELAVTDAGIGIASVHLNRVFERFYRVPSEAVRSRQGTGLGLFVVRSLARNLGGDLRAHSTGINAGCTMVITLPTNPDASAR